MIQTRSAHPMNRKETKERTTSRDQVSDRPRSAVPGAIQDESTNSSSIVRGAILAQRRDKLCSATGVEVHCARCQTLVIPQPPPKRREQM